MRQKLGSFVLAVGANELNVQMIPLVAPAFTFSNVSAERVPLAAAPAWNTMNFYCTITNPNPDTVTKLLNLMLRRRAGEEPWIWWSFELTLEAGQIYDFAFLGNTYGERTPNAVNGPGIDRDVIACEWLEDEQGNKSREGCVHG